VARRARGSSPRVFLVTATKFYTYATAVDFAREKSIKLDGAMTYIGQLDFTDSEMQLGE